MAYAFSRSLTIDHTQCGSSDSSSFAVLVKLDSSNAGTTMKTVGNGGHIQNTGTQSGGNAVTMPFDLAFTSDGGGTTKIPWEVDYYDGTGGTLWAWVLLSTVSHSSNTVFYVFYGDATVNTQQNTSGNAPSAVWDTNYKAVYHLPDGTTLSPNDSTGNTNNATNSSVAAGAGQIDGGGVFTAATPSSLTTPSINLGTSFTVSGWVKFTSSVGTNYPRIAENRYDTGFFLGMNSNTQKPQFIVNGNISSTIDPTARSTNTWYYITGTYNGTTATLYINGSSVASSSDSNPTVGSSAIYIGKVSPAIGGAGSNWDGPMDELRFSATPRGADWILTEYNNQNNPESFVTAGAETSQGGTTFFRLASQGVG